MNTALLTDLYELTMCQGYFLNGNNNKAVFDMFFRRQPFNSGYSVFAGLEDILEAIENFIFTDDDISYLSNLGLFRKEFLDYLKNFKFRGDIYSVREGTLVFPNEPVIKICGSLIETQIIESLLLNIINFQTLIATKTARMFLASGKGEIIEFGLRRAQGINGAIAATRASFIGGACATSNLFAGKKFGIPVRGTMAHSWIMSYSSEETSFREYANMYPDACVLLIDTYDTLNSGIENAIKIGKELKEKGKKISVRLDSGDLEYLSKAVRKRLDDAGLTDAGIVVSNELDEEIIHHLVTAKCPIDVWGVGTKLVTGDSDSALSGVYKLAYQERDNEMHPVIKVSNQPAKTTLPGDKKVYRFFSSEKNPLADLIILSGENNDFQNGLILHHPDFQNIHTTLKEFSEYEELLEKVVSNGNRISPKSGLKEIRERTVSQLDLLDETYKRLINPHTYKVSLSKKLSDLKFSMIEKHYNPGKI